MGSTQATLCTPNADLEDVDSRTDRLKGTCMAIYAQLEECLGDNNRDWRKCQEQASTLRQTLGCNPSLTLLYLLGSRIQKMLRIIAAKALEVS